MDGGASEFRLEPIWDATVEVYHEIRKICDSHGLRYYMSDGNALGAIRHGCFIPWDDDFDMTMPRPDYEKFIEYCKTELPEWLRFVCNKNTPEFKFYFGKVQVADKNRVERVERESGLFLSNGLFVDIFPLDGYPASLMEKIRLRLLDFCFNQMIRYRSGSFASQNGIWEKLTWLVGAGASVVLWKYRNEADLREFQERKFLWFPFEESEFVGRCCTASSVLCRKPMKKTSWGEPCWVEFYKGEKFPLPADTPAILVNEYGDWRKLPPEEERHPSHEYSERVPWWLGPTKE